MMELKINNKIISDNSPCFIIAEAGVNHATRINGIYQKSVERAKKLIDVAVESGADAIKFQTFKTDRLILKQSPSANYHKEAVGEDDDWYKRLERESLNEDDFKELFNYCKQKNIIFLSTPYEKESVDLLERINVPAYKISSGDITNLPLLEYISQKNKPIILSTGMSDLNEIEKAIEIIKQQGNNQIIILQCTANYPIKIEESNLNVIKTLKNTFGLITGYSDHTIGNLAVISAVSLGAKVIEKHITLNKNDFGPDHRMSLEPLELKEMINYIRETEKALGSFIKQPTKSEINNKNQLRKSIVTIKDIFQGSIITRDMIDIKRPGTGLSPKYFNEIIGKKLNKNINKDKIINYEDIEWNQ
tara:strand:- start:13460 stop:14542 length:1083 start_codon:yes stop_codon:yes gene_type:complete